MKNRYECGDTLIEAVNKHSKSSRLRFHMPGHKGKGILGLTSTETLDMTELPGLDNLHFPKDCIARSERLTAELFGAKASFFIVNGSSAGIIASILALSGGGKEVVCARNSHISLFRGLCLSGARPVYVMPEIIAEYGLCGGIEPDNLEEALKCADNACAVFITSPTYEGFTSNVAEIADIAHKYNVPLIVDEAHGAHFKFGRDFPETALEQGADIAVQSWHKTLAAYGQGSVLHIGSDRVDLERLRFYLSVMQTTSPSYAIMASLDRNRELLQANGEALFKDYESNLKQLRESIGKMGGFGLISDAVVGKGGIDGLDRGKITLAPKGGGKRLEAFLRERGVYIEASSEGHALLMTSFADCANDYEELIDTLSEFTFGDTEYKGFCLEYRNPEILLSPSESLAKPAERVCLREAAGRISAGFIAPYPPGVPLVAPGEVIPDYVCEYCAQKPQNAEIHGVLEGKYLSVLE